jgi:GxxExxY protein
MEFVHKDITEAIIGAAFEVHNVLGYGFLEKVYQNAMIVELRIRGFQARSSPDLIVIYKNEKVGFYHADLCVNESVIVELKVAKNYNTEDEAQILNELKSGTIKIGLLINFGKTKVEFKRFIM